MTHTFANFGRGASKIILSIQQRRKEFISFLFSEKIFYSTCNSNLKSCIYVLNLSFDIEFSPDQTGIRIDKSIERHLESNAAQFFLGGATGYVRPTSDDKADVIIENSTSRSSLMLHLVQDDYYIGDLSNIVQRIHFSVENLNKSKTSEYQSNEVDKTIYKQQWLRKTIDALD